MSIFKIAFTRAQHRNASYVLLDLIRETGRILNSTWELHFQNGYKQMENTEGEKPGECMTYKGKLMKQIKGQYGNHLLNWKKFVITGNGEKWFTVALKRRAIGNMLEVPEDTVNLNIMKHFLVVVEFAPLFPLFFHLHVCLFCPLKYHWLSQNGEVISEAKTT